MVLQYHRGITGSQNVVSEHVVKNLFIKQTKGAALCAVESLRFSRAGIDGNTSCSPLRQILILPHSTLDQLALHPGQLRENVVVEHPGLHELESGTELTIGAARIRLTFHCEPCGRVVDKARASALLHKRGYLGLFLNAGEIYLGDKVETRGVRHEPVPYAAKDRIRWALERKTEPVTASTLLFECGVPIGYARALPRFLAAMPPSLAELVMFTSRAKTREEQGALVC